MTARQKRMAYWARILTYGIAFAAGELDEAVFHHGWQSAVFVLVVCLIGAVALDLGASR